MAEQWYALRSKPRKEIVVWRQVLARGFESYFPRIKVNPVNPRSSKVRAYFPGYLFVKADIEDVGRSTFQWMPHTLGLVSFGGEAATVPESLIHDIRKRVDEINAAGGEIFDGLKPGEKVWIKDGPFKDYQAIFDARLPGSERVRVLLELLNSRRQVPVELDIGTIERKQNKKKR